MADLHFAIMELLVKSDVPGERFISPTKDAFEKLENNFTYSGRDGSFYDVSVKKRDNYIFFVFKFGNPEPRDENLTNIKTGDKTPNKRTIEEAELNKQAFFLFHYEQGFLYASSFQKRSVFVSLLKERLQIDFKVKSMFMNEQDFINILSECNSISFTHINNLFSSDSPQKQALVDLTGTDAPEEFKIIAKYKPSKIVAFIKNICKAKRDNKISSLTICGIDEDGFDTIYNADTFRQKIKVSCKKDGSGYFIADSVCDKLLREITNER